MTTQINIKMSAFHKTLKFSLDGKDYDIQAGIGFIVTSHIKRYSVKGNIDLLVSVPK